MKIALAFFGIPRNSSICFPSIEQNIYRHLPSSARVGSFYHLYEPQLIINPRSGENGFISESNYHPFAHMTGNREEAGGCLERWDFDEIRRHGDVWGDDCRSLTNLIHQLNSLHAVTELVDGFDPDVVLFVRPDLLYHDALPGFALSACASNRRAVYIPHWQWWNGLNDRFAVCGRDVYGAYGRRAELMIPFCLKTQRGLHAERLLRFSMGQTGSSVRTLDMRASRVRLNGELVDETFSSKHSMGRRENRFILPVARMRSQFDKFRYRQDGTLG
ncbi:hypothetical protein RT21_04095 [Pseudomonas sp. 10B238]|uniref:hypothetical protein n=1 Tax=Pseudomonas sp. 10B238 TaxID=1586417 RepID=UPI0006180FD8|nr:hypothetical protein [Pseudomonas sp. 10B238]KJJ64746.1 hypothetical protein RT21_04095 [Pseudomonas sp. 10B238]